MQKKKLSKNSKRTSKAKSKAYKSPHTMRVKMMSLKYHMAVSQKDYFQKYLNPLMMKLDQL